MTQGEEFQMSRENKGILLIRALLAKKFIYILSSLLIVTGLSLIFSTPKEITKTYVQFPTKSGQLLKGALYSPLSPSKAAVILIHGVVVNKEYMGSMAESLALGNILALTFDLGGYGESYARPESDEAHINDALTAVDYIRKNYPLIEDDKIGLVGHSMGGTIAIFAAIADSSIKSVACLGMSSNILPFTPCNVLWSTGLYDQFHRPDEMRQSLKRATGKISAKENQMYQRSGCLQRLFFSSTANHQTEMSDYQELSEVTRWMSKTLKTQAILPNKKIIFNKLGRTLLGCGLFLLFSLLLCPREKKRAWACMLIGAGLLTGLLSYFEIISAMTSSTMIIFLFFLLVFTTFWRPHRHKTLLRFLTIVFGIIVCIDGVNIINAIWEYTLQPSYAWHIPIYLLQTWLNYFSLLFIFLRPHFFIQYTTTLIPAWSLVAVVSLELISPGIFLRFICATAEKMIARCQFRFKKHATSSPTQVILLVCLLIVLSFVIFQRAQGGYLNAETFGKLSELVIRRILPTIVFVFILLRKFPPQQSMLPREKIQEKP